MHINLFTHLVNDVDNDGNEQDYYRSSDNKWQTKTAGLEQ